MPHLELISQNPNAPTVRVKLLAEESAALGGPRQEVELVVTMDLDWSTIWPLYRKAVTSKGGKARVGNGALRISRQR